VEAARVVDEVPQLFRSVGEVVDLPDVIRVIARLVADQP